MTKKLILASSSKPRKMLLERLKIPFGIIHPDVDESPLSNEPPTELVQRLSKAKANKAAQQFTDAIIIGADQVGVLGNDILCKPLTREQAVIQLKKMSGNHIEFLIGLCVLDAATGQEQAVLEQFSVTFRNFTDSMIENYLNREAALECAGSFKAEGLGIALVEKFHGEDFTALIGLPLIRLIKMLENAGISIV